MATSVGGAFQSFRETFVDLDPNETTRARSSRDYLFGQLAKLSQSDGSFPCTGTCLGFGSFARKTKKRPLDDIDFMLMLRAKDTQEGSLIFQPHNQRLYVTSRAAPLAPYADVNGYINSIRVLNKVKSSLSGVPNYSKSEIKRNQQAVTLNLISYAWNFDIVPAAAMSDAAGNTVYYLIPNGSGEWMRTDPRANAARVTTINQQHGNLLLPLIRLLKYWNGRVTKPRLMSFYFETLVLKVFDGTSKINTIREAAKQFFDKCPSYLYNSCPSPTGHGPALDDGIDWSTKQKIATAMAEAAKAAGCALSCEAQGNVRDALAWWKQVFGSEFPSYG